MNRLETAQVAYGRAFRVSPPEPFGVDDDALAAALEQAVADGKPLPDDFGFWDYLPPGGLA